MCGAMHAYVYAYIFSQQACVWRLIVFKSVVPMSTSRTRFSHLIHQFLYPFFFSGFLLECFFFVWLCAGLRLQSVSDVQHFGVTGELAEPRPHLTPVARFSLTHSLITQLLSRAYSHSLHSSFTHPPLLTLT